MQNVHPGRRPMSPRSFSFSEILGLLLSWEYPRTASIEPSKATRFIQIAEQFGKTTTSSQLPVGKIFEMLSLPSDIDRADFVSKPHTIPSTGATKTVDEMPDASNAHVRRTINFVIKRKNGAQAKRILLRQACAPLTLIFLAAIPVCVTFRQHIRHARTHRANHAGHLQRYGLTRASRRQD